MALTFQRSVRPCQIPCLCKWPPGWKINYILLHTAQITCTQFGEKEIFAQDVGGKFFSRGAGWVSFFPTQVHCEVRRPQALFQHHDTENMCSRIYYSIVLHFESVPASCHFHNAPRLVSRDNIPNSFIKKRKLFTVIIRTGLLQLTLFYTHTHTHTHTQTRLLRCLQAA